MAVVQMAECDNPKCKSVGTPENAPKRPTKRDPYVPPYGWLTVRGGFVGCGPFFVLAVCSKECLAGAIQEIQDEEARQYS